MFYNLSIFRNISPTAQLTDKTSATIRFPKTLSNFIVEHFPFLTPRLLFQAKKVSSRFENQIDQVWWYFFISHLKSSFIFHLFTFTIISGISQFFHLSSFRIVERKWQFYMEGRQFVGVHLVCFSSVGHFVGQISR